MEQANPQTADPSFHAGWLIDGTGSPARRNVLVRVADGLITSLDSAPSPAEIRTSRRPASPRPASLAPVPVTDFTRCTVIPPLVDSHVHLFMSGTADPQSRKRQLDQPFPEAADAMARHLLAHFSNGVLAVRDGGDHGGYGLRFRDLCRGRFPPVRIRSPGRAWRTPGRYGALIGRPPPDGSTLPEALAGSLCRMDDDPRGQADPGEGGDRHPGGPDHVKIVQSGLNSLLCFGRQTPPQFSADELKAAVGAAARHGLRTMVHANGRIPVRQAVEAGCHSVEHGFFMGRENLERMAGRTIVWVPTVFPMAAYATTLEPGSRQARIARQTLDHQLEQLSLGRTLGVATATGSDAGSLGVHHGDALKREIRLFMEAGYSLEAALSCATTVGARLLGLEEELGTLAPGRPATFIVAAGSPQDLPASLHHPEAVYVRGRRLDRT